MGLLSNLFKWGKVQEKKMSNALENGNEVDFAGQDLEQMEKDYRVVLENMGKIKARKLSLERDVREKKEEITDRMEKAEALLNGGNEELAKKHCEIVEDLETEVGALEGALKQQNDLYVLQEKNKNELKSAVDQAKRDIKIMKTMSDVAKSNESISVVDTSNSTSALSAFQDRKKKMQEKLDVSKAMLEEKHENNSLEAETQKALGKSKGSDLFNKLKNKI
jgi:phage shock protein A